jgi:hypothetical protein
MTERDAGTLVHAPASRAPSGMGGGAPRSHEGLYVALPLALHQFQPPGPGGTGWKETRT